MTNLLNNAADWTPTGLWNDAQEKFEFLLPPEDPVLTVTYPGPTAAGGTLNFRYEWSFGTVPPPVDVIVNGAVIRSVNADEDIHLPAGTIPVGSTLALRATRAEPEGEFTANGCRIFRIEPLVMFVMQLAVEVDWSSQITPILRTFRGYRGSANTFETWIRDAQGRANLAGAEIRIRVHAYDRGHHRAEVVGEGTAEGRVTFTISHATTQQRLPAGLYRLEIVVGSGEDRQTAQVGLLELI